MKYWVGGWPWGSHNWCPFRSLTSVWLVPLHPSSPCWMVSRQIPYLCSHCHTSWLLILSSSKLQALYISSASPTPFQTRLRLRYSHWGRRRYWLALHWTFLQLILLLLSPPEPGREAKGKKPLFDKHFYKHVLVPSTLQIWLFLPSILCVGSLETSMQGTVPGEG